MRKEAMVLGGQVKRLLDHALECGPLRARLPGDEQRASVEPPQSGAGAAGSAMAELRHRPSAISLCSIVPRPAAIVAELCRVSGSRKVFEPDASHHNLIPHSDRPGDRFTARPFKVTWRDD